MMATSISTDPAMVYRKNLTRGVDAALVAPDADQEVHGDQRNFPEDEEQEQVERAEDADQPEFEQQQECDRTL